MTATIAPLVETDLPEATRIFRVAFCTFLGAPDPETFWSDRDYLHGRWHAPHVASFGAHLGEKFVGSNFATRWGSVGFFGPITVRPDLQEGGIAQALPALPDRHHDRARGYRTAIQGVNMHRRNEPGYCRPGIYAIDDWR